MRRGVRSHVVFARGVRELRAVTLLDQCIQVLDGEVAPFRRDHAVLLEVLDLAIHDGAHGSDQAREVFM